MQVHVLEFGPMIPCLSGCVDGCETWTAVENENGGDGRCELGVKVGNETVVVFLVVALVPGKVEANGTC